jgi:Leucine Rich repeat
LPPSSVEAFSERPDTMLRRPRLTLSLRWLMILVLIVGGVLGWKVRRASIQRRAVNEIRRVGGMVYYEHQVGPDLEMLLDPGGRIRDTHPWAPAWLQSAVGAEYFQEVALVDFLPNDYRWRTMPASDEQTLAALATLDRLEVLGVGNWVINDAGLARLAGMPRLKRLLLDCATMTDSGLATLPRMPALEVLELDYSRGKFSRDTAERIAKLSRLKRLGLIEPNLSDPAVPLALADLKWLESLDITSSSKAATFLFQSRGLTKLRGLHLPNLVPTDSDLANVSGLTRLEQLELDYSKITDAGLVHLSGLTRLAFLDLSGSSVTGPGLAHLAYLSQLWQLNLSKSKVTDAAIPYLVKLTNLRYLDLSDTAITDLGAAKLRKALVHLNGLVLGPKQRNL